MTQRLELSAPAKINLGLEILRRRPDGYHDLNTLFATLDVGDSMTLTARGDHKITCRVHGAELAADDSNLAVRAALALQARLPDAPGLDIEIQKRIPMGAGLGGGSSDAAAVLMGAPHVWGIDVERAILGELALELGSDVPFFLIGGVALAGSRGERLEPIDVVLPWHVLLVNPGIHVATPAAFASVGRTGERAAGDLKGALLAGLADAAAMRDGLVNDFEAAVFAMYPELGHIKRHLYEAGALFALMSGSGSTMFGLFETRAAAEGAREHFSGYWTTVARFGDAHSSASSASSIERSE